MAMLGIAIPIGLESASNETVLGLVLVTAAIAAMTIGAAVPTRSRLVWGIVVVAGFALAHIFLPPSDPDVVRIGSVLIAVLFWLSSRAAIRRRHPIQFAQRSTAALVLVLTMVFALRLERRFQQDATAFYRASSPQWGNVPLKIAEYLASQGIAPGTTIALIGPHAESYWARSGRLNIVANVPRTRVSDFWKLPAERREALLREFAAVGATVAVASIGPEDDVPDSSWTPVKYRGWIRKLR